MHGCGFLPPYMLRAIAAHGDDAQRDLAHAALETSAQMRGERSVLALAAALPIRKAAKRRSVFDAGHKRSLPGKLLRDEGDAASGDAAADEAFDGAGTTYDFYAKVLGRKSVDDRGLRLDSSVHYGVRYDNAMWNGRQMIYGDGDGRLFQRFTKALDVIGHELTHGVTQYTAALAYEGESGALNEHMSDVFGVLIKQFQLRQTASEADWLVGAGLFTDRVRGIAVRSMKAPGTAYDDPILGRDPQPAHMRDFVDTQDDNGGVHLNSGIPNRAFHLAASAIGGFAWETAGRIWYAALTTKLRRAATFRDCAQATIEAAGESFRARRVRSAVDAAWREVGVLPRRASKKRRAEIAR